MNGGSGLRQTHEYERSSHTKPSAVFEAAAEAQERNRSEAAHKTQHPRDSKPQFSSTSTSTKYKIAKHGPLTCSGNVRMTSWPLSSACIPGTMSSSKFVRLSLFITITRCTGEVLRSTRNRDPSTSLFFCGPRRSDTQNSVMDSNFCHYPALASLSPGQHPDVSRQQLLRVLTHVAASTSKT